MKNFVVFSVELGEQGYRLEPYKAVSPLPLPVLPYQMSQTGLVEDTVVWPSEQFKSSKLSLGLVS